MVRALVVMIHHHFAFSANLGVLRSHILHPMPEWPGSNRPSFPLLIFAVQIPAPIGDAQTTNNTCCNQ